MHRQWQRQHCSQVLVHRPSDQACHATGEQRTGHQAEHHRLPGDHLHHDDEGCDRSTRRRGEESCHAHRDQRNGRLLGQPHEQCHVVPDARTDGQRWREDAGRHTRPGRDPGGAELQQRVDPPATRPDPPEGRGWSGNPHPLSRPCVARPMMATTRPQPAANRKG